MIAQRPLLIGLIVSAALNLFLIGGIAGALWMRPSAPSAVQKAPGPMPMERPVGTGTAPDPAPVLQDRPQADPAMSRPVARPSDPPARPALWTAGKDLSPETRQALRRTLRDANQRNRALTRQAQAERQAAIQLFRSGPYDPADVSKRLGAARALDLEARGNVESAVARFAATLSPAERATLADGLARVYAPRQKGAKPQED
ncbi:periplasmic heavy metal sensor [Caulobacter henricii]|uniref:Periplasmic heavy metal sensor n=1 Tax=Caulobacter henricii TaxID=69395 RepID=A0A0N7JH74_9CAUL|nr:periplasmic heavy metal sensor [Caulobacter henricii]ALL12602.1 hypothetical protein AQ619_04090 [Caulobacter henricii]